MFAANDKISNLTAATGMNGYKAKKYFKEFLNRNSSLSSLNDLCMYSSLAALHIGPYCILRSPKMLFLSGWNNTLMAITHDMTELEPVITQLYLYATGQRYLNNVKDNVKAGFTCNL